MAWTFKGYVTGDGEVICENCVQDGDDVYEYSNQETDCPQNCSYCNRPIECTLTKDGVEYVYKAVKESLKEGLSYRSEWKWPEGISYYAGMGTHACTRDWAEQVLDQNPKREIKRVLEYYLYFTEEIDK